MYIKFLYVLYGFLKIAFDNIYILWYDEKTINKGYLECVRNIVKKFI